MCARGSPVGSTCCGYAGRHTTCREYCQAIFRTDSTPTVSQINAVKEYCQSHSAQLLSCVSNFTKSYPIRSPIDSKSHPYVLELTFTPHKFTEGYIVRMYFVQDLGMTISASSDFYFTVHFSFAEYMRQCVQII